MFLIFTGGFFIMFKESINFFVRFLIVISFVFSLSTISSAQIVTGTGAPIAIPDATGGCGTDGTPGAQVCVDFSVSGRTLPVTNVSLNLDIDHTWLGDLNVTLLAPGGSPSIPIINRIGSTGATSCADGSDFGGAYTFSDGAAMNPWTDAVALDDALILPPGDYRTVDAAGNATSINAVFAGLTPAQANGTWQLCVVDTNGGDTGTINSATLGVFPLTPTAAAASIRGSVVTESGIGIGRALVTIFNTNTGDSKTSMTNPFGYFRFENLPVGHFYTMSVQHRQYSFEPQSFTLENDIGNAEFRSDQ